MLGPRVAGESTRNSLMNEPVVTLDDRDPFRTDILHEYFVAPARLADFVRACQAVIPASYQQLLDITVRYVDTDHDSVLAYAPGPRMAAVLLFSVRCVRPPPAAGCPSRRDPGSTVSPARVHSHDRNLP